MMKHHAMTIFTCVISSLTGANTFAESSDTIKTETTPEEEIVVTSAQKRSENINDVPIAMDVISSEFIESVGASGLSELEFVVPSVNFGRGGRKTRGEIAIRGIGDFSRNIGTDARVVVYIDDVPLGRSSAFNVSLLDIDQIEILKGPQGTLFGTNTIAGAINIITKAPESIVNNEIRVDVGNRNQRLFSLRSNLPFSESAAGKLQVSRVSSDGFLKNITLDNDLQGDDSESARLQLRFEPTDNAVISTNFDWLSESINATNALALADDGTFNGFSAASSNRQVAHDAPEFEERDIWGGSVVFDYELASGSAIKSITAYRNSSFEELSEEDYSPIPAVTSTFDEEYEQWTQEMRFVSRLHEKFDYVTGVFLSAQETETQRSATLTGNSVITPGNLKSQAISLYANGNYRVSPLLEINLGARFQNESKKIEYEIEDNIGLFVNASLDDDRSFTSFLPRVSFNFNVGANSLFYTSISRGTKGGGWNADFVTSLDNIYFKPEYSINYEAGYKSDYWDGKVNVNASAFVAKFDDYQVFQFVDDGTTTTIQLTNAGEATSQGLELGLDLNVSKFVAWSLNASYTKAEFDRFRDGGGIGTDYDGNTLAHAPELAMYTAINGNIPIGISNKVFYYLDYSYTDGYFSNPSNEPEYEVDDYYTLNGRIGLSIGKHWEISLWGKNLTDETNLRSRDVSFLQIERGYFEAPRSYGLTFTFSQS